MDLTQYDRPHRMVRPRVGDDGREPYARFEAPARPTDQHCALCIFLKLLGMGPQAERLALRLLERYGSIGAILQAQDTELEAEFGLPHVAIAQFRTVAQLHDIALTEKLPARTDLGTHASVQAFFVGKLRHLNTEKCLAIFLDNQYCLIKEHVCSVGSATFVAVDARALLKAAIVHQASAFVIAHNHPTGNADPSEEDIAFTEKLSDASHSIGIELVDHVIVARNHLFSFASQNLIR